MTSQSVIDQINRITRNNPGYSANEEKTWELLANNSTPNEQEEILKFLEKHSKNLSPDYYDIYDREGILNQMELAFFEAQTRLSPDTERKEFFEAISKNSKLRQPKPKITDQSLESIKNEKDISDVLIALGPKGIIELEEGLVKDYLKRGLPCSLSQLIEALHSYCAIKNTLTEGNIKFMQEIIAIYTNTINQFNEQRKSALLRAEQILNDFLKKR